MTTIPNLIVAAYFVKPEALFSDKKNEKSISPSSYFEILLNNNRLNSLFCKTLFSENGLNFEPTLEEILFEKATKINGSMNKQDVGYVFKMMSVLGFFDMSSSKAFDSSRISHLALGISQKASKFGFNLERDVSKMSLLAETKVKLHAVLQASNLTTADDIFDPNPSEELLKGLDDLVSLYVAFYERLLSQNRLKDLFEQNQSLLQKVLVSYAKYKKIRTQTLEFVAAKNQALAQKKIENEAAIKAKISEMAKELRHIHTEVSTSLKEYLSKYSSSKTLDVLNTYLDDEEKVLRALAEDDSIPDSASSSLGFFEQHYRIKPLGGFLQLTEDYLEALKSNNLPQNVSAELDAMLVEIEKGDIVVPGSGTKASPPLTSKTARNNLLLGAGLAVLAVGGFYIFKKMKKKKRIK